MKYEPCMSGWYRTVPVQVLNISLTKIVYTIFCLDEFNINYEQAKILPNIAAPYFLGTTDGPCFRESSVSAVLTFGVV